MASQFPLSADAESTKSYGSTANLEWHDRGKPLTLVVQAAAQVGRHVVALSAIVVQIYFSRQSSHLMNCDSRIIGLPAALACECTKGFVRYFPLLALLVSLMVVARLLLGTRAFYELLRHDALLDFENFSPLRDPLFRTLLVCIIFAVGHFVFAILHSSDELTLEQLQLQRRYAKTVGVFYLVPTIVFIAFLWTSYDIEAALVPLSKYMEEDPVNARRVLANVPFIPEASAAQVVRTGLSFEGPGGSACESSHVYTELIAKAEELAEQDVEPLSDWRLVATMWPAELLLDARLCDTSSAHFRWAWYGFSAITFLVMGFVFFFFAMQGHGDLLDVLEGQYSDGASLLVELAFVTLTVWLMHGFANNALVPFRAVKTVAP